jgi:RND family efflux transporter MFP subunit
MRPQQIHRQLRRTLRRCVRSPLWLTLVTVVIAVVGATTHVAAMAEGTSPAAKADARPVALAVVAARVELRTWPLIVEASGPVAAWEEASVGTLVGGLRVIALGANVGDVVKRGAVLVRFDTDSLVSEEAGLRAEWAQAQAQAARADADAARAELLKGGGAISDQDALQYRTQADMARAQVAVSTARLAGKRLQLKQAIILAPDDGVVSARSVSVGAVEPAGQELYRLIRRQRLEWRGELTAAQIAHIRPGQIVRLSLPDGSSAVAHVRQTAPGMNPQTRLGTAYADIDAGSLARPGMFASARIELPPVPARVVPTTSVLVRDGRSVVALLDESSSVVTVRIKTVVTGRRTGGEVEIVDGLRESDRIVKEGASFLGDGDAVRLVAPPAAVDKKG